MANTKLPLIGGHPEGFGTTIRTDNWWLGPLVTVLGLGGFFTYATWAAFQGEHYFVHGSSVGTYLSPFYSPVIWTDITAAGSAPYEHAWTGAAFPEWLVPLLFGMSSPALLILPFPGSFRLTCYYYRKAYYRSFAGQPPGCAVGPRKLGTYKGEAAFLIFQNLHRYALYFALIFVVILYYDAFLGLRNADGEWGIGIGTVVLFINATLLAGYTFGCHSFRHLIGGHDNQMSCQGKGSAKQSLWGRATWCNERHMRFAWVSLFWVGFSDVYIRLLSMGFITDLNTWN